MLRKKATGGPEVPDCSAGAQLSRPAAPSLAHGPPALSALGPAAAQLWPRGVSGLSPASAPRPAQRGQLSASEPNEHNVPFLVSQGQKRLPIPQANGGGP